MIKAIEKRADWFTTDLYQIEPWDKEVVNSEADKYKKYGITYVISFMACMVILILLCAVVNLIVTGDIQAQDLEKGLIVLVGFALGGIYGVVTIIGKFKDKLERGY